MSSTPIDSGNSPSGGATIAQKCLDLRTATNRGDLGGRIAFLVLQHSPVEIQRMNLNFSNKIRDITPGTGTDSQKRSQNICWEPISVFTFWSNRVPLKQCKNR